MKKKTLLKMACAGMMLCCLSTQAHAQDLKSILGEVAKNVIGNKATTASSIVGTWTYHAPKCQFDSESTLAKAGGEVAAKKVEKQMENLFDKIGVDNCQYTFNEDGTYAYTKGKRTVKGTYTFDDTEKSITMKRKLGGKATTAYVSVTGNNMSLVFNADKLMSVLQSITGAISGTSSTAAGIHSIANSYDGLMLGFELKK